MPMFTQTDVNLGHSFHVSKTNEAMMLGFEVNAGNIFNQHAILAYNPNPLAQGTEFISLASADPLGYDVKKFLTGYDPIAAANTEAAAGSARVFSNMYGKPMLFQSARTLRLSMKFSF